MQFLTLATSAIRLQAPFVRQCLTEQASITLTADLDGVDNFQGSTSITGHGYQYDGDHRRDRAAALLRP